MVQPASSTQAGTCGRAKMNGFSTASTSNSMMSVRGPVSQRPMSSPISISSAATEAAVSKARPFQPPTASAPASIRSVSHSCAIQGRPAKVSEKGSLAGTCPVAAISRPVAMCQPMSPSLEMPGDSASSTSTNSPNRPSSSKGG